MEMLDCEKIQSKLSDFLDKSLCDSELADIDQHLHECFICSQMRDDLVSIIFVGKGKRDEAVPPPNAQALWLRISNTIECENAGFAADAPVVKPRPSVTSIFGKRWELTFSQFGTIVTAVVVSASLLTVLGFRQFRDISVDAANPSGELPMRSRGTERVQANLDQRRFLLNNLSERVEQRKQYWNPQMRVAFERNMKVLDQTVDDALLELSHNPDDEVTQELVNAALQDKVDLLEKFSQQ